MKNTITKKSKQKIIKVFTLILYLLFGVGLSTYAQVTVSGALTGDGSYSTLGAAFTAINPPNINTGANISIQLSGSTTETASAILNSSDWASVEITASTAVTISGSITGAIVKLNGADNVTIDGRIGGLGRNITIQNNSTSSSTAAIWIAGTNVAGAGATNNTIRNCNILCGAAQNTSTSTTFGILIGGTTVSATATSGLDNDNNSIIDNYILKCRTGICTRGASLTNLNQNTIVTNNIVGPTTFGVDEIGIAGILLQFENNCNVSQNEVRCVGGDFANTTSGADRVGIGLGTSAWGNTSTTTTTNTNFICSRNLIHDIIDERTFSAAGIVCGTTNGGSPTNNIVCDNMIYNVKANGTSGDCLSGIGISGGHSDQIVNNSIYLYGDVDPNPLASATSMLGWGIRISAVNGTTFANLSLKNNIVHMNLSSSSTPLARYYAIGAQSAAYSFGTGGCDYNNYYLNPLNPQLRTGGFSAASAVSATTEFVSLLNWQGAFTIPQDLASLNLDPGFNGLNDLHINVGNPNMNDVGTTAICNEDFDGDLRSGTPDIGADEYTPLICTGTNGGLISPATVSKCFGQTHSLNSIGYTVGAGATYQWEVSSTPNIGFSDVVDGTGATTPNYTTAVLPVGVYYFRMRIDCNTIGVPGYSNEVEVTVHALPVVDVIASLSSLCQPGASPSILTASGAVTYAWAPITGLNQTSGSVVDALPTSNTTYTVTGTDANGCSSTSASSIAILSSPILSSVTATPSAICMGGNSQLNANISCLSELLKITEVTLFRTGTGFTPSYPAYIPAGDLDFVELSNIGTDPLDISGVTYEAWTGTTVLRSITFPSGTVIPANDVLLISLTSGTNDPVNRLYFTGTSTTGPLSSSSASGHLVKQGVTIIDAVATNAYVWPLASLVSAADWTGTTPFLSGRAGVIRIAPTDGNTASDWVYSATPSPLQSIGTYNTGYIGGTCTFNYSWSPSSFIVGQESLQNPLATAVTSTTSYTVVVTNPLNNCTSTGSVTVAINPLACDVPTIPSTICSNTNFNITSNVIGGGLPYTYVWDDGMMGVYPNSQTITANLPVGSYTYTVTVLDGCGVSCTSSITVVVNETPSGMATGTTNAIVGDNLYYAISGYNGTPNFQWQSSASATGPWTNVGLNADTYTVATAPVGTTYVQCVITNANGCSLTTNQVVTSVLILGDNVCNAIPLPYGISGPYSNVGATIEVGEPTPAAIGCNVQNGWCILGISNSVWFSFVAPPSGRIQIGNGAPLWDNQFALYSATNCNDFSTFVQLAANDDSSSSPYNAHINSICLVPGQTYYLQLDGYGAGTNAAFYLNLINETSGVALAAKAILSGAYDLGTGLMHDSLRAIGSLIPLTEPYTAPPFNKPAIGEASGETTTAGVLGITGNDAIVDWVFIEIRSAATPSTILATKRALIQRDGDIVGTDGVSPVSFGSLSYGTYHVSLKHRNHLGIMTATPVTLGPCVYGTLDFTTTPLWVKAGEANPPAKMYGSVATLWAADANYNKNTKYNGLANDKASVLTAVGAPNNVLGPVYRAEDANMDGKVKYNNTDNDRNVIAAMVGVSTPNNIVNQHTPN